MVAKKKIKVKGSILQPILTGLLVLAAFAIGSMWTELKMLKGGSGLAKVNQTGQAVPTETGDLPEEATEVTDDLWNELLADPAAVQGNADALVTLVEFTDYQCPFCKRHFDETASQLMSEYVDSNKVFYIVRDLPLSFHENAHGAAQAARCAGDQNAYMKYHDKLFEEQAVWSSASDTTESFTGYAGDLGLNTSEFSSCLTEGKYKAQVDADLALAQKVGANGTPSFFINGKKLVGAQPFSSFKTMIEAALE